MNDRSLPGRSRESGSYRNFPSRPLITINIEEEKIQFVSSMIEELENLPILLDTSCVIEYYPEDSRNACSFGMDDEGYLRIRINKGFIDMIFRDCFGDENRRFTLRAAFYHECGHLYNYYYNGSCILDENYFNSLSYDEKCDGVLEEEISAWNNGYELYTMYDGRNNDFFFEKKELAITFLIENKEIYLEEMLKYNNG